MPFDTTPEDSGPERPFPPPQMWTPTPGQCRRCAGKSAIGKGECCNECGLNEDGTKT